MTTEFHRQRFALISLCVMSAKDLTCYICQIATATRSQTILSKRNNRNQQISVGVTADGYERIGHRKVPWTVVILKGKRERCRVLQKNIARDIDVDRRLTQLMTKYAIRKRPNEIAMTIKASNQRGHSSRQIICIWAGKRWRCLHDKPKQGKVKCCIDRQ